MDSVAEWSKAVDLRPTLFGGAGSNPAQNNYKRTNSKLAIYDLKISGFLKSCDEKFVSLAQLGRASDPR